MQFYGLFLLFVEVSAIALFEFSGFPALMPLEGTHTWFESYKRCKLVGKNISFANIHDTSEAWIGGYFTNTRWTVFIGGFKITPNKYTTIIQLIAKDTEKALVFCSNACSSDAIFTIQKNWCVCFGLKYHEKYNSQIDYRYCNNDCICDGRNWYKGYQHINGHLIPRGDSDQSLRCSVEIRRINKLPLYDAIDCEWCKKNGTCVGIQRYKNIQWTGDWSFVKVCEYFQNHATKCVLARRKGSYSIELVEEPCTNLHPAACDGVYQKYRRHCPATTAVAATTATTQARTTEVTTIALFTKSRTTLDSSFITSADQIVVNRIVTDKRTVLDLGTSEPESLTNHIPENTTTDYKVDSMWSTFSLVLFMSAAVGVVLGMILIIGSVNFIRRFILYRRFYQESRYTEFLRAQAQMYSELGHIYEEVSEIDPTILCPQANNEELEIHERQSGQPRQPMDIKTGGTDFLVSHSYENSLLILKQVFSTESTSNIQKRINQQRRERTTQAAEYGISRSTEL